MAIDLLLNQAKPLRKCRTLAPHPLQLTNQILVPLRPFLVVLLIIFVLVVPPLQAQG